MSTSVNICHLSVSLSVSVSLQGPSSLGDPSNPSSASTQQPRGRHSFVQDHFQAQYR